MSAVVDASVLVAAVTDAGTEGEWAMDVIARGALAAPHLVLVESANILRGLERASDVTRLEATAAHADLIDLDVSLFPYEPFAERVWELRDNLSSYDAWYVAIAENIGIPLATLDLRLSRASGPSCEFLLPTSAGQGRP